MFQELPPWIAVIAMAISVLALLYSLMTHAKYRGLKKKYDFFMRGEEGQSLERRLSVEVTEIREASAALEQLFKEQARLKSIQGNTFQKIGFVKYNAFENIGNDLSFSLTLLDGNNNGICISSVYGRNESRIFSKPIIEGRALISLRQEELASVNEAGSQKSNQEALISASIQ